MKFEDLDARMRVYEQSLDQIVPPGNYIVARLDGRSFTRLTKEVCRFDAPFDIRFNRMMVETVKGLVAESGFEIVYGYTQSDEISLLFAGNATSFGRKVRKLNSILAGEASARFSLLLGRAASFDGRIIPLPNEDVVADYFRWRMEDTTRNCLNSWCYWTLRKEGGCRPGFCGTEGQEYRLQKRFLVPARHQLQRPARLAAARRGCLLA
ncbi:MAG: tRNA(His) guanylyltransferase Thg1 family protein [Bacteroidales bacterium]|nr:tRNA(His) guanylyltransferase Thg1 family protein [Bacteroidales bacterium]MBQ9397445.1 tRNA(His) guanylyltransferase Thg1 family protein [Bacteroidales bacterium]